MQNHKIQTNKRKIFKNISIYKIEKKILVSWEQSTFCKNFR